MKFICSLLVVRDLDCSRIFYEEILGLRVSHDHGENIVFENGFALHCKDHFSGLIDYKTILFGENNVELYFESNELEMLQNKLLEQKIEFIHPIRQQSWKQKVIRFYDPDGYVIEVGEPMSPF